jgi:hypothetical protein
MLQRFYDVITHSGIIIKTSLIKGVDLFEKSLKMPVKIKVRMIYIKTKVKFIKINL